MNQNNNSSTANIPLEELRLMTRAAWLYYIQGLTQTEVAKEMDCSRVKVTRLIARAKNLGIVDIRIKQPAGCYIDLEQELITRFNLRDAVVTMEVPEGEPLRHTLAHAAVKWLTPHLNPDRVVGISMGRTLALFPDIIDPGQSTETTFIEVMGASDSINSGFNSYAVISRMAQNFGGVARLLDVPTFVSSQSVRDMLMSEKQIAERFEIARSCDILMTSVGTVNEDALMYQIGYISKELLTQLQEDQAVGDLLGHFFDEHGQPIPSPFDGRLMALQLEDLKRIPYSVLVSGGQDKIRAMKAALLGNYVNVLITDVGSAQSLLAKGQA